MSKMSPYLSAKIRIVSFFAIILVVYAHTFYWESEVYSWLSVLQWMVGVGVAKGVAIPMFFAISGYLFFYGTEQNGKNAIYRKIYKRVYTLLVPYVLWNIWFALIYLLLHNIPNVSNFINSDIIGTIIQQDVFKNLKMMFWDPCAFHLWFIRNLFIAVLCTPFLYKYLKFAPYACVISVMMACYYFFDTEHVSFALMWFILGGFLALHNDKFESIEIPKWVLSLGCMIFISYIVMIGLRVEMPRYFVFGAGLISVLVVWKVIDIALLPKVIQCKILTTACSYTFFIYLFHEPTLNIIKKLPLSILGTSPIVLFICYIFAPWIMVIVAIGVAWLLQSIVPKFYSIIVGGR
ncbi:acyltransferase family protein [Bacteroides difficilis]|uniref:Acyltransferase n=1 Tax=Bacteroides difficilis TaxID=2763021 RepID=A0ABR7CHX9_9BACE|nr:acyltransferase [Bacteroides difficilis]MBC5607336.1 acyltransferase [Bacteroides difficilis]